jgi:hypothetical protein
MLLPHELEFNDKINLVIMEKKAISTIHTND